MGIVDKLVYAMGWLGDRWDSFKDWRENRKNPWRSIHTKMAEAIVDGLGGKPQAKPPSDALREEVYETEDETRERRLLVKRLREEGDEDPKYLFPGANIWIDYRLLPPFHPLNRDILDDLGITYNDHWIKEHGELEEDMRRGRRCDLAIFSQDMFNIDFMGGLDPTEIKWWMERYRAIQPDFKCMIVAFQNKIRFMLTHNLSKMPHGMSEYDVHDGIDGVSFYIPFGAGGTLGEKLYHGARGRDTIEDIISFAAWKPAGSKRKTFGSMISSILGKVEREKEERGLGKLTDELFESLIKRGHLREEDARTVAKALREIRRMQVHDADAIEFSRKGYTSKTGFALGGLFFKVDIAPRMRVEDYIYRARLGEYDYFKPRRMAYSGDRKLGILALENAWRAEPGYKIANRMYGHLIEQRFGKRFTQHGMPYNLFLMGLFHKEATNRLGRRKQIIYEGVHGLPHYEESCVPSNSFFGRQYRKFRETAIKAGNVRSIISEYREEQNKLAMAAIHGDWKHGDNLPNGRPVDYPMVGRGFEVDEIAYYASDRRFGLGLREFHAVVDFYIEMRKLHDPWFGYLVDNGYGWFLHEKALPAFLSQLTLRHSVMNKRDMADPEKLKQREYYKWRIQETLKEAKQYASR